MPDEIDYPARYQQLAALCRELCLAIRAEDAEKIIRFEQKIGLKLEEWQEL